MLDFSQLQGVMNSSLENLAFLMQTSIQYQSKTTEISTYLGQVASRAAKQSPQG